MVAEKSCNFGRYICVKVAMEHFEIIKCHGSGNDFILIDICKDERLKSVDWSSFARVACNRDFSIGSDGLLLVVRDEDGVYGMDMLNPDGTHAEMCGNGIRCVARYAIEQGYISCVDILRSGGRDYRVAVAEPLAEGIAAYAVDINISLWSCDFALFDNGDTWLGKPIVALSSALQFSALSLGNPHIVAAVDAIDMAELSLLGERVKEHVDILPNGVNVSLYECRTPRSIFVATYERGAGITLSCGTAMTASATAAALLGFVERDERIEVKNRGGKVYCTTYPGEQIVTRLEGNATYVWRGDVSFEEGVVECRITEDFGEQERWESFVKQINE